jgi:hypothetical protein
VRISIAARPLVAALRSCGALLILIALILPSVLVANASTPSPNLRIDPIGLVDSGTGEAERVPVSGDEGECDGESSHSEELIDCGSDLEVRLGEPLAITLLRRFEVRTTQEQCRDLLAEIWEQESCTAQGRECGKLLPGAIPHSPPKLSSSSASGQIVTAWFELDPASSRRLGRPTDERMPKLRDLSPPVPPPRLAAR